MRVHEFEFFLHLGQTETKIRQKNLEIRFELVACVILLDIL